MEKKIYYVTDENSDFVGYSYDGVFLRLSEDKNYEKYYNNYLKLLKKERGDNADFKKLVTDNKNVKKIKLSAMEKDNNFKELAKNLEKKIANKPINSDQYLDKSGNDSLPLLLILDEKSKEKKVKKVVYKGKEVLVGNDMSSALMRIDEDLDTLKQEVKAAKPMSNEDYEYSLYVKKEAEKIRTGKKVSSLKDKKGTIKKGAACLLALALFGAALSATLPNGKLKTYLLDGKKNAGNGTSKSDSVSENLTLSEEFHNDLNEVYTNFNEIDCENIKDIFNEKEKIRTYLLPEEVLAIQISTNIFNHTPAELSKIYGNFDSLYQSNIEENLERAFSEPLHDYYVESKVQTLYLSSILEDESDKELFEAMEEKFFEVKNSDKKVSTNNEFAKFIDEKIVDKMGLGSPRDENQGAILLSIPMIETARVLGYISEELYEDYMLIAYSDILCDDLYNTKLPEFVEESKKLDVNTDTIKMLEEMTNKYVYVKERWSRDVIYSASQKKIESMVNGGGYTTVITTPGETIVTNNRDTAVGYVGESEVAKQEEAENKRIEEQNKKEQAYAAGYAAGYNAAQDRAYTAGVENLGMPSESAIENSVKNNYSGNYKDSYNTGVNAGVTQSLITSSYNAGKSDAAAMQQQYQQQEQQQEVVTPSEPVQEPPVITEEQQVVTEVQTQQVVQEPPVVTQEVVLEPPVMPSDEETSTSLNVQQLKSLQEEIKAIAGIEIEFDNAYSRVLRG